MSDVTKKKRNVRPREKKTSFSIYVSEQDKVVLEKIASRKDTSVSAIIRTAIDNYISSAFEDKKSPPQD